MTLHLVAALAIAVAVLVLVPQPGERRLAEASLSRVLPPWLAPLPGALPARRRAALAATVAVAVGTLAGGWGLPGWAGAVVVGVGGFVALGRFTSAAEARRRQLLVAGLPQACDLLAVAVEAGLPVSLAVGRVADVVSGPIGDALGGVAARVRLGIPESDAWAELAAEPGLEGLAREVARVVSSGIGLAGLLRELARDARLAAASEARVRARRVGVQSVMPLMLCFLPAFVLLGIVPVFGGILQAALS